MADQIFSTKGELNAFGKKEAMEKLVAYAQALSTGVESNSPAGEAGIPDAEKEALLVKALSSERGKLVLAQAMAI
jgi:hypothetical protein